MNNMYGMISLYSMQYIKKMQKDMLQIDIVVIFGEESGVFFEKFKNNQDIFTYKTEKK